MLQMRETVGRHEVKHRIHYGDYIQLRSRLSCVAKPDENALDEKGYKVRSLYFDNYADKALREKLDGLNRREKFRLRLYNDRTDFIRLEKKSKQGGLCFKESAAISKEDCEALLAGQFDVLKRSGSPLLLELYAKMQTEQLRPKTIIDYQREAFVFPAGNVRVTLDYDLRSSSAATEFLNEALNTVPLPGIIILEVKYDAFLPEIIRGMVALSDRQSTAFSKYAVSRLF